jgi:imidazolonepropionase-like amidohydrolase
MSLTSLLLPLAAVAQGPTQSAALAKAAHADASTAFVNVSVIPMDREQVLTGQTVVVRGSTIAEVGPAAEVKVPAGATRVDGQGKFLLPGLADMHMHFFSPQDGDQSSDWYVEPRLFCYVANGVTTIRAMALGPAAAEQLKKAGKGELPGPRVHTAGTINRHADASSQQLSTLKNAGFDFAMITSRMRNPAILDSLAAGARAAGIRLAGDVPAGGLDRALKAPYGSIEQLQGYIEQLILTEPEQYQLSTLEIDSLIRATAGKPRVDTAKMRALVAATKQAGVWNVPLQAAAERMIELWSGSETAKTSLALSIRRNLIKALHAAGAGLLLGTDAPAWGGDYGFSVHQELQAFVAAGLTPYQALETSTRNVAAFLGTLDSAGTIAAGKRADLVLLSANPLEDIRHTVMPAGVMVNGRWLPKAKLDAQLKIEDCSGR